MASMMSFTKSRGCEVVNRTRRIPDTSPDVSQQRRKVPAGRRRIAIAVHVLAEQLNFGVAHARPADAPPASRFRRCGCAPDRA